MSVSWFRVLQQQQNFLTDRAWLEPAESQWTFGYLAEPFPRRWTG